jgi:hypothetical protein
MLEVNAVDLGIYMNIHSVDEEKQQNRLQDPDALPETVDEAWNNLPVETTNTALVHESLVLYVNYVKYKI